MTGWSLVDQYRTVSEDCRTNELGPKFYLLACPLCNPCFLMLRSILVSVLFLSAGMGFSFRVKALRFVFKAFSIRFVYTCSLHVPFMLPCTLYVCKNTLFLKSIWTVYPRIRLVWTSPDAKNDQWIRAHLFVKIRYFSKVFRLFTPRVRLVWTSLGAKHDQWIRAHLFVKIRYVRKLFRS